MQAVEIQKIKTRVGDITYWQLTVKIGQTKNILKKYWYKFLR